VTTNLQRTGAALVEDREAVLVRAFCGKVAPLAKTTDDLPSTSRLGELLANLLLLGLFFIRRRLKCSSVFGLKSISPIKHSLSLQHGERT